jgi:hypothetical protein
LKFEVIGYAKRIAAAVLLAGALCGAPAAPARVAHTLAAKDAAAPKAACRADHFAYGTELLHTLENRAP